MSKYDYETISSFVEKLKTLPAEDEINIEICSYNKVFIDCNDKGLIQRHYADDKWNSLYLTPGKTRVSEALKVLEPLTEKNGSCLIEFYTDGLYKLINRNSMGIQKTHTIVPFEYNDLNVRKTHIFTEEQYMKWQKQEFYKNLEHFMKLTKNDENMLCDYLIKCCVDYPKLDIYIVDTEVFTAFEDVKERFSKLEKKHFVKDLNVKNLSFFAFSSITSFETKAKKKEDEEANMKEYLERMEKEKKKVEEAEKEKQEKARQTELEEKASLVQFSSNVPQGTPEIFYRDSLYPYTEKQMRKRYPKVPFELIVRMFTNKKEYLNDKKEKEIIMSCPDYVKFIELVQIMS